MKPETKKKVGIVAICVACIAPLEGLREVAYKDPVGIPTICFGETRGVKLGDKATRDQCEGMLAERVERDFIPGVKGCLTRPVSEPRLASYVSLAYNIGIGAFCRSSIARKHNAGDPKGACDAMLLYTKAGGIELPGLVKRRQQEHDLCLSG